MHFLLVGHDVFFSPMRQITKELTCSQVKDSVSVPKLLCILRELLRQLARSTPASHKTVEVILPIFQCARFYRAERDTLPREGFLRDWWPGNRIEWRRRCGVRGIKYAHTFGNAAIMGFGDMRKGHVGLGNCRGGLLEPPMRARSRKQPSTW